MVGYIAPRRKLTTIRASSLPVTHPKSVSNKDLRSKDDPLTGDAARPPFFSAPGWFSILDTDYAMILISQMHKDIQAFI
jgi:hypothetical protein